MEKKWLIVITMMMFMIGLPPHDAVTSGDQDWVLRSLPVATQVYSFVPDSVPFLHPVKVTLLPKL